MISAWAVYWILTLDSVISMLAAAVSISMLAIFVSCVALIVMDDRDRENYSSQFTYLLKVGVIVASITIPLSVFIPNTKQMATILLLPAIANNENVQEFAGDSFDVLHGLVKGQLKELAPPLPKVKKSE